jgi:hypothetical protein
VAAAMAATEADSPDAVSPEPISRSLSTTPFYGLCPRASGFETAPATKVHGPLRVRADLTGRP